MQSIRLIDIFNVKMTILEKINKDIAVHCKETAYVAYELSKSLGYTNKRTNEIMIAGLVHDIGTYKTYELMDLMRAETATSQDHSIYGYVLLQNSKLIEEDISSILYHHHDYNNKDMYVEGIPIPDEAFIIGLADRVSLLCSILDYDSEKIISRLKEENKDNRYNPFYIQVLEELEFNKGIIKSLKKRDYDNFDMEEAFSYNNLSFEQLKQVMVFLPLSIDFFSFDTALHTISISAAVMELCNKLNIDDKYSDKIAIGAYLHDIGKVCIGKDILDNNGKLTKEEFEVMKEHVVYTKEILEKSNINREIIELACNHHEKLDGSGYPRGLKADSLTIGDRIIAIADILCALVEKRKYKESFNKEKIIEIIEDMAKLNYIDANISKVAIDNYEEIYSKMKNARTDYESKLNGILDRYNELLGTMKSLEY